MAGGGGSTQSRQTWFITHDILDVKHAELDTKIYITQLDIKHEQLDVDNNQTWYFVIFGLAYIILSKTHQILQPEISGSESSDQWQWRKK
jgi:hypothetical protein